MFGTRCEAREAWLDVCSGWWEERARGGECEDRWHLEPGRSGCTGGRDGWSGELCGTGSGGGIKDG